MGGLAGKRQEIPLQTELLLHSSTRESLCSDPPPPPSCPRLSTNFQHETLQHRETPPPQHTHTVVGRGIKSSGFPNVSQHSPTVVRTETDRHLHYRDPKCQKHKVKIIHQKVYVHTHTLPVSLHKFLTGGKLSAVH